MNRESQQATSYGPTAISGSASVHQGNRNNYYITNVYGPWKQFPVEGCDENSRKHIQSHALASDTSNLGKGIALLALNGGATSGMYTLYMLQYFMEKVARIKGLERVPKPCEFFDMIGGSGIGG